MNDEIKNALKEKRKAAHKAAKERQRADPKYQAMKEQRKALRKAAYEQQKARRKEYVAEQKAAAKAEKMKARSDRDKILSGMLFVASDIRETSEYVSRKIDDN